MRDAVLQLTQGKEHPFELEPEAELVEDELLEDPPSEGAPKTVLLSMGLNTADENIRKPMM